LYYRLNVLPIHVPPLRERRSDIPALIEVLSEDMAQRGTPPPELTSDALALLAGQSWRGNIRELRNALEQAVLRSDSDTLDASHLKEILRQSGVTEVAPALAPMAEASESDWLRPLAVQVAQLEQRAIVAALQATGGNKLAAARLLKISRATLYERMENPV
jgi:DNA-binding NtrC family response regulator